MKLENLFKWKNIKRCLKTTLILTLIGGSVVALNNTFNDDHVNVIMTKEIDFEKIELNYLKKAENLTGEPSAHRTYATWEDDKMLLIVENYFTTDITVDEKIVFSQGIGNGFHIYVFSKDYDILRAEIEEFDVFGTVSYVNQTAPTSNVLSALQQVKNHVDFEVTTEVDDVDYFKGYIAEFDLTDEQYANRVIDNLTITYTKAEEK